jgi:hypothetical protein
MTSGTMIASSCYDETRMTGDNTAFFEMVIKGRVARPVEDLDDDTLSAIASSSVSAEHAALDDIISEWTAPIPSQ